MQQPIGNEFHGPDVVRPIGAAQGYSSNIFSPTPPPALRNLQNTKAVEAPKSLIVHVRSSSRASLVAVTQTLAPVKGVRLGIRDFV